MKRVQKQLLKSFNNSPAQTKLPESSPNNRNQTSLHEKEATGSLLGRKMEKTKLWLDYLFRNFEASVPAVTPAPGFPGQTPLREILLPLATWLHPRMTAKEMTRSQSREA